MCIRDRPECRWQFRLEPGDAYALRGGYARERCAHGVSIGCAAVGMQCKVGCRACRISLNLRCGLHSPDEVAAISNAWHEDEAEKAAY